MDFSPRLDELQQRVTATKTAVQAAVTESREQLRQRIDQAQQDAKDAQQRAEQRADQAVAGARTKWAQLKADAAAKMDDVKAKMDKRTQELDAKGAAFEADGEMPPPLPSSSWGGGMTRCSWCCWRGSRGAATTTMWRGGESLAGHHRWHDGFRVPSGVSATASTRSRSRADPRPALGPSKMQPTPLTTPSLLSMTRSWPCSTLWTQDARTGEERAPRRRARLPGGWIASPAP